MSEKRHTILIVDDEQENLDLLEATLRRDNKILKARNAEEALLHLDSDEIHMIITDQRMPGMQGTELLARTTEAYPDMIRMLITGYDDARTAIDAINQGRVHRYASKPWDPREIKKVVELELERYDLKMRNIMLTDDLLRINKELVEKNDEIEAQRAKLEKMAEEFRRQKDIAVEMSEKFAQANLELLRAQEEIRQKNLKLEAANKKLQHLSITDGLTGFYNHRHMQTLLEAEIGRAKRYDLKMSLLMLDLDKFKDINDNYGHLFGDAVLKRVADIIRSNIRETDLPSRYGGDEFLMILPHTGLKRAQQMAQRIHADIRGYSFVSSKGSANVTVSVGISGYPNPEVWTKDDLIRMADSAMYEAKNSGRDRITSFGDEDLDESDEQTVEPT
ncbi:MAG: diguanylate cyclase [Candidatus Alcyoniella australis]|nr:diguanylate cyclase [Candidatus Alcyoniella australis]